MLPSDRPLPQVTILTPTWNRRHLLPRLYQSLLAQQAPPSSFEWLVVDDGSTDGTSDWLESLVPQAPFPIRVIRQENGGKHRALNRAAKELASPWGLIVDSDDWLLPDGMAQALAAIAASGPEVLAISAPIELADYKYRRFHLTEGVVNFAEWNSQRARIGDTSDIFRSHLLQDYPFPEFPGEKFIAEGVFSARAFREGGIRLSNQRICACEYQPDGLSQKALILRIQCPLGAMANYEQFLKSNPKINHYIRYKINFYRFYTHASRKNKTKPIKKIKFDTPFIFSGHIMAIIDLININRSRKKAKKLAMQA